MDSEIAANLPASVIQAASIDPAAGTGSPPNFGQEVVPHIHTASGRYGISSHAYLNMDEALRDSRQNAERMRADCGIMECIEQRQRSVALLPWHLEPEDDKDPAQQDLAAEMTAILEETPRFTEFRRNLLDAIWYGRAAVANQFGSALVRGKWRTVVRRWEPRHGDKLVFRFDDGDRTVDEDQIGIRVSSHFKSQYIHNAQNGRSRFNKIQPTEMGLVYWLDRYERKTMCVHKHMIEDGPWEDPRMMGRVHGIGVRDRIYWTWYAMVECLQRVVEYLDRAAFGIEVWPYPAGNQRAKTETENAAVNAMGGGRTVILAPLPPGEDPDRYMPQLIEPGLAGVNTTIEIIRTYFGHKIKRYILGQTLSSEADATGLGSGVADAHLATLADILTYDASNLEETLTKDFLAPLQHWNFPDSRRFKLRFRINTESDNVREKMEAIAQAWSIGLRVKADEIYQIIGASKPDGDDETLSNPQLQMAAQGAISNGVNGGQLQGGNGNVALSPESFHQSFMQQMGVAS